MAQLSSEAWTVPSFSSCALGGGMTSYGGVASMPKSGGCAFGGVSASSAFSPFVNKKDDGDGGGGGGVSDGGGSSGWQRAACLASYPVATGVGARSRRLVGSGAGQVSRRSD